MATTTPQDVARIAGYLITHVNSGHTDPSHPKYPKYVKDLGTLIVDARRVLYRINPPATEHEILTYLVRELPTRAELEKHVSAIGDQIKASATGVGEAANAAANRVIDLINSDRSEIEGLKAQALLDAAAIKTLQDQIDAGTVTPEAAQEVIDIHNATVEKLADLDSDPLTSV